MLYSLKDAVPKKANGLLSNGAPSADLLESNQRQRPSYNTFPNYQRRDVPNRYGNNILHPQHRNDFVYPQSSNDEVNENVFRGMFGNTSEEWAKDTKKNIERKNDFDRNRISAKLRTLSDEDIAQKAIPKKIKIVCY